MLEWTKLAWLCIVGEQTDYRKKNYNLIFLWNDFLLQIQLCILDGLKSWCLEVGFDLIKIYYKINYVFNVEQFLFQRAECNLNFDLHKIVFCFHIHKGIQIIEHTKMKPKKLSMPGCFNQSISISPYVIYDELWKHWVFTLTTTHFHINNRLLMWKTWIFTLTSAC